MNREQKTTRAVVLMLVSFLAALVIASALLSMPDTIPAKHAPVRHWTRA